MSDLPIRVERIRWGAAGFKAAKKCEFDIFGVSNRFVSSEDVGAGEMLVYRPYERFSEFHVAYREGDAPVGILRLIRYDPSRQLDSFSTLRDARAYSAPGERARCYLSPEWQSFFGSTDPATIAELATQAVLPEYRRRGMVEYLWESIVLACESDGVVMWTMALVVPLFRWYKAMFPNALHCIGELMPGYVGADSLPAMIQISHASVREYRRRFWEANSERRAVGLLNK
jgi:hypothetical protein